MAKLKLGVIVDEKPVKLTVELPVGVHRDLLAYAEVLARETGQTIPGSFETHRADAGAVHVDRPGVSESASRYSSDRRRIALPEKVQKIRQRRVFIVFSPTRRIAYPAQTIAVSYLSIYDTRNLGADVRFQDQGHARHDANKALDDAPIDVMAFNSGTVLGRPELGDQEFLKLASLATLAQQDSFAHEVGPVNGFPVVQRMSFG